MIRKPKIWDISPGVGGLSWYTDIKSSDISGSLDSSILFLKRCLHGLLFTLTYRHDDLTGIVHFSILLGSIARPTIFCSLRNWQCPNLWWNFKSSADRLGATLSSSSTNIFYFLLRVIFLLLFNLNWVGDPDFLKDTSFLVFPSTSLPISLTSASNCS